MSLPNLNSPYEAALWWIDLGFSPVPIPSQSKNPGLLNDAWQELRIVHSNAAKYFNGKAHNIGVLTGFGDAADVDHDWPEALRVSPSYLPVTPLRWGRASAPESHHMFRSAGAITKQFKDPLQADANKATVIELRARKKNGEIGMQTVVPPGLHHSGEKIEFYSVGEPATVAPEILLAAVSKIAAAALLSHYWPAHGRHDTMLALAGVLARAGWKLEEALKFCRALYRAIPTHDPAQLARSDSEVASTFEKFVSEEEVTGFPSLARTIDSRVIAMALDWLGIRTNSDTDWRKHLLRGKDDGPPLRLLANACIAFREAPEWQGVLAYNEFASRTVTLRPAPWQRKAGTCIDDDDRHAAEWLQLQGIGVAVKVAAEGIETVAREKPFHPVRDFLKSLSWDEVVRLDLWLTAYFQVEETEYTKAVAARWLIAAVARVFEPGCRADQVLVLHGEQGLEKSSGLHALFGDEWFADHLSALGSKDARQELQGKWGIELGELLPTHRAENGLVKNFISTRVDHFRPSYGWRAQDFPRQCIFAATTNVDSPFTDETGNRRFWSVNCGRVDVKALAAVRDQLWAEAYARYRRGDPSWLETSELNALAEKEQRTRYEPGARDDLIEAWIQVPKRRQQEHEWDEEFPWFGSEPGKINTTDVLIHGLGIPQAQIRTPQDSREVARCLRNLGYKREQLRRGEKRGTHYFVKPASPPEIRKES